MQVTVSSPEHSASEFPSWLCPDLGCTLLAAWFESAQLQSAFLGCMEDYLPSFLFKKNNFTSQNTEQLETHCFSVLKMTFTLTFFFALSFFSFVHLQPPLVVLRWKPFVKNIFHVHAEPSCGLPGLHAIQAFLPAFLLACCNCSPVWALLNSSAGLEVGISKPKLSF